MRAAAAGLDLGVDRARDLVTGEEVGRAAVVRLVLVPAVGLGLGLRRLERGEEPLAQHPELQAVEDPVHLLAVPAARLEVRDIQRTQDQPVNREQAVLHRLRLRERAYLRCDVGLDPIERKRPFERLHGGGNRARLEQAPLQRGEVGLQRIERAGLRAQLERLRLGENQVLELAGLRGRDAPCHPEPAG